GLVRRDRYIHLGVKCEPAQDRLIELESIIQDSVDAKIQWRRYEVSQAENSITYSFQMLGKEDEEWYLLVKRLLRVNGVKEVELKESKVT
ncbi:MAG: hypothetical protein ACK4WB_08135, partial [Desulfatiglandales bacterium]